MLRTAFALGLTVSLASLAGAYDPYASPTGSVDGPAGQELAQIRGQTLGQDLNVGRITQQTLARNGVLGLGQVSISGGGTSGYRGIAAPTPQQSAARYGGAASVSGPAAKPFANVSQSPTVSPYMLLFQQGAGQDTAFNYQTLVQPMLRQRDFNDQVNRQQLQVNSELNALRARNAYNVQGSEQMMPTGHVATFNNTLRFYPQRAPVQRR